MFRSLLLDRRGREVAQGLPRAAEARTLGDAAAEVVPAESKNCPIDAPQTHGPGLQLTDVTSLYALPYAVL